MRRSEVCSRHSQSSSLGRFARRILVRENGATTANKKVVFDDGVESADSIAPGNFFSFFVGTAVVRDTDFVNSAAGAGYFGRDFGFESEAIFAQINGPDDGSAECLVASFHVSEIDVCAHV